MKLFYLAIVFSAVSSNAFAFGVNRKTDWTDHVMLGFTIRDNVESPDSGSPNPGGPDNGGGGAPEPSTMALIALGGGLAVRLKARRNNKNQ